MRDIHPWDPTLLLAVRHGQRKTALKDDGTLHYAVRSYDSPVAGYRNGRKITGRTIDGRLVVDKVARCCPFCMRWSEDAEALRRHLVERRCLKFRKEYDERNAG